MNQGGEQGHDDNGLPPVDIEIPDDARELFRDVQAYHRELRAVRRHERSLRWRAPFRRSGVAIPLLAGCLIAALVAVMVSAMFTNPYLSGPGRHVGAQPSTGASRSTRSSSSARPSAPPSGKSGSSAPASKPPATNPPATNPPATRAASIRLPGKTISVAGSPLALSSLRSTALAIVPGNCDCVPALRELLRQVETAGVIVYLVAVRGSDLTPLNQLARSTAAASRAARVAADPAKALVSAFRPDGLTVLLVDAHGQVQEASRLEPGLKLEKQLMLIGQGK